MKKTFNVLTLFLIMMAVVFSTEIGAQKPVRMAPVFVEQEAKKIKESAKE